MRHKIKYPQDVRDIYENLIIETLTDTERIIFFFAYYKAMSKALIISTALLFFIFSMAVIVFI